MQESNSKKRCAWIAVIGLFGFIFVTPALAWDRIVVLNPMIAEWSAEILGKEKTLKKIIGTSEYSNYPSYMKSVAAIGPYPNIQIEKILSLHPDLVIASSEYNRIDQIEKLKKLKLNVVTLPRESFHQMEKWILELGAALGEETAAKTVVLSWKKDLQEIKAPQKKTKRAFFEIQYQPLITVGRDSFVNDSFKLVGIENIFETMPQSYPKVSKEAVLAKKPEIVFVFEMVKESEDLEKIKSTWKQSRVHILNGDDYSRCSPRLLKAIKGVQYLE